jgi:5'-nucleotidase
MRILLSNDDGILAPGLLAMYKALQSLGEVHVVAPETAQSGGAHAITIRTPVLWRRVQLEDAFTGTSVEGTPADCVKLAIHAVLEHKPDLIVSGINAGLNSGVHVLYSGTVAAAIEGAIQGFPAIAVSLEMYRDMDFDAAARIARGVIDRILADAPQPGQVFNINIPEIRPGRPKGVRVAPQSPQSMPERIEERTAPYGRQYYWLAGDFRNFGDSNGTDRQCLDEGYVCVTPLQFDMTDAAQLERLGEWDWAGIC